MHFLHTLKQNKRLKYLTLLLFLFECISPVSATIHKILFIVSLTATLYFFTSYNKKVNSLFLAITLSAFFLTMSCLQSQYSQQSLQSSYLAELQAFEGTRYWWGGENSFGIDCSGLPRKAFFWALLKNGRWQESLDLWLYDSSAQALGEEYRQRTLKITTLKSVKEECSLLQPGDLAITASGVHVLVYIGHSQWMQADPLKGKVFTAHPELVQCSWFDVPLTIVRWSILHQAP